MPKLVPFKSETQWSRLDLTAADWKKEDADTMARLLEQLLVIRRFEEKILELKAEDMVHGPAHASIGQEGGAVGAMSVLGSGDKINGTHRMHHQFLAKVLNHATTAGYDPRKDDFPADLDDVVYRTMAEIMGLTPGYCGGRGGSMHLKFDEAGVMGSNAIVGGNPPHAAGYSLADKMLGTGNISVAFFGDGALQNGAGYETMNMAALYDLPMVFFIENNLYAVSTHLDEQTRETRLTARAMGLAIPSIQVDGMDLLAVRKAMQWARDLIANDRGPAFIEAQTYRYYHQSGDMPGSAFGYRSKTEEEEWRQRDPVTTFPAKLTDLGILSQSDVEALEARALKTVEAAASAITETEPGTNQKRIIPALWPDPGTVEHGIRGGLSEFSGIDMREVDDFDPTELEDAKFVDVIARTMVGAMERDERIIVLGEDVHRLRGGTSGATKGIGEKFPDRLIGTPICENGFVGMGVGAALNGLRPVVEIMYPDFCLVAADQLFNQAAKVRHMFGGTATVPLVVRSRVSAGAGYGSQHSMDASGLFALYPGWRIVAPSTPFDYVGLMNAALHCEDPVLVVEHMALFQNTGPVPAGGHDHMLPLGKARIVRPGSACTVVTYLSMIQVSIDAADSAGIDAEVIDLRVLDPLGIDWPLIEASIQKTNRLIVVEENTRGTSHGARIVEEAQRRCFDWLDHEILRVSGTNSSPVVSKVLEDAALARQDDVVAGLKAVVAAPASRPSSHPEPSSV